MSANMDENDYTPLDTSQRIQSAVGPLLLLVVLYYGYSYIAYETTFKRSLYELLNGLMPERVWQLVTQIVLRAQGILPLPDNNAANAGGNNGGLQRLYSGQGVTSVVQKARRLSGLDKFVTSTAEASYPGLGNWDNSCFQNSVLQGLASMSSFYAFVERSWRSCVSAEIAAPALEGLQTFLDQLQQSVRGRHTVWPPSVLRSMNTWQQQDAQEYFSKILDAVDKEVAATHKKITRLSNPGLGCLRGDTHKVLETISGGATLDGHCGQKVITPLVPHNSLEGYLSQKLRCQRCGFSEGLSLMPFNCLTLNLGLGGNSYLETLLDNYFEAESIDGVECDECTRIASQESASKESRTEETIDDPDNRSARRTKILSTKEKHILFGRLPENLAIHINRSIFDEWGNQRKNNSFVEFPARLKIWGDWVEDLGGEVNEVHSVYELRCIINHSGRHDNGHYIACGKRRKDWFLFNDEIVTKMSESDVLARGNVFMLFYEKLDCDPIVEVSTPESESSKSSALDAQDGLQISEATQGLEISSSRPQDSQLVTD